MGQDLPYGQYRVRRRENKYRAEYYGIREHASYIWLQFEAMRLGHTIFSKWTKPGEKLIATKDVDSGKPVFYRLDGYRRIETSPKQYEEYGYEFSCSLIIILYLFHFRYNECHETRSRTEHNGLYIGNSSAHGLCDKCKIRWENEGKTIPHYLEKKRIATDKRLQNLIATGIKMKVVWSCTVAEMLSDQGVVDDKIDTRYDEVYRDAFRDFVNRFSGYDFKIARREYGSHEDIVQDVMDKNIGTGWMLIDAHVPRKHHQDFFDLPPLYDKRVVTPEDVGPKTVEYLQRSNTKLSKQPLLIGTFHVTNYLMNFETVRQLVNEVELCITNIHLFIEFDSAPIFADYVKKIYNGRVQVYQIFILKLISIITRTFRPSKTMTRLNRKYIKLY